MKEAEGKSNETETMVESRLAEEVTSRNLFRMVAAVLYALYALLQVFLHLFYMQWASFLVSRLRLKLS